MFTKWTLPALVLALLGGATLAHAADMTRTVPDAAERPVAPAVPLRAEARPPLEAVATGTACAPACRPACAPSCRPRCGCRKDWAVDFGFVSWVSGMDGTLGVRGREAEVDVTPGDVIENLDKFEVLLQGFAHVRYKRFFLRTFGQTITMGDDIQVDPSRPPGSVRFSLAQVNVVGGYSLLPCGPPARCGPTTYADVFAGVRYNRVSPRLTDANGASVGDPRSWADPIVGGRFGYAPSRRWLFDIEADIGGFGVASDLTWRVRAGVTFHITRWLFLNAGWGMIDTDYTRGSGSNRFVWDILQYGPYMGIGFSL